MLARNVAAQCNLAWEQQKNKKGGAPRFPQGSKTIVADHQQRNSAICAVAIHPRRPNLIVR